MLADVPVRGHPEITPQLETSSCSSLENLVQRISIEVEIAEDRVHFLQTEAANVFVSREHRQTKCQTALEQIQAILLPRLQALMSVDIFKDIRLTERGVDDQGFDGRTTTLTVPSSDNRPTPMELSFHVGHDDSMEIAVLDYRLEILPIFIKFDSHDQLVIPIDDPNEETISTWIDDKLVGFTQTYFEVYFHAEYQKKSLVLDPVMNVLFPKSFAVVIKDYQGQRYHFYTNESFQKFQTAPSRYVATT